MVALRTPAGATGITGYSRLNKAELLAKLRGSDEQLRSAIVTKRYFVHEPDGGIF